MTDSLRSTSKKKREIEDRKKYEFEGVRVDRLVESLSYEEAFIYVQMAENNKHKAIGLLCYGVLNLFVWVISLSFAWVQAQRYRGEFSVVDPTDMNHTLWWGAPFLLLGLYLSFNAKFLFNEATAQVKIMRLRMNQLGGN